jgi:hypothetical protein
MMANMVGEVQVEGTDFGRDSAKVHVIKPHNVKNSDDIIACYQEGVGLDNTFLEYLWDGATASTIGEECIGVYRFIVEHYTDEHEIWLFGFSRGSFTCRCVAGMINNCGIMKRRKDELSEQEVERLCYDIFRKYRSSHPTDAPKSDSCKQLRGDADRIWQIKQPIRCMSLIDTLTGDRSNSSINASHLPCSTRSTQCRFMIGYGLSSRVLYFLATVLVKP